ncbi:putative polysaccharide biosynthesis protein [Paenibacillus glycanilyticus]|uniref:Stage V sporulation protein B n=1 Tax=Paenibacillus glycanilyticus TaxID=126569 RepID=A0ABQ6GA40_9BACL|nr:polysaccharide biosynthesis protein [Paenibacillus glycanilyticus]GLX65932.1 stage V sporulation protein B [Paenibacillus glycanilyticus]
MKKDSLIKGTLILAAAALIARFLGIFQRVPLDHILAEAGGTYFAVANNVYLTLLVIATGGLPSAISKMVSERYSLGREHEAKRVYQAALLFGIVTGVILTIVLYLAAPYYAIHIAKTPGAEVAIRAVAPTLLIFPIIAMMRGYFQGRQFMMAGGMSQIVEQILRVIVGVALAYYVVSIADGGEKWGAAAATFGNVIGGAGALLVMLYYGRKLSRGDLAERSQVDIEAVKAAKAIPFRSIYREIFTISVPIVITAMTVQIIYTFDSSLFVRLTETYYGYHEALKVLRDLGFKAQTVAGIPPILAIALSTSIIPVISSAYSLRNTKEVERQVSLVMRIVLFTGVPAALTIAAASYSVTGLLFKDTVGYGIVAALTAGTIFQITMMTSNSILFGLGKQRIPMMSTFVGIALKILCSYALAPIYGVYGVIMATSVCFVIMTWLNLEVIRREVKFTVLGSRWPSYIVTIVISVAAGWGTEVGIRHLTDSWPDKLTYLVSAVMAGAVIGALYLILLVLLRVVTMEDAKSFPGPLRKLFVLLLKVFRRSQTQN